MKLSEIHGSHDEVVERVRDIRSGLCPMWEAMDMRNIDGNEGNEIREEIKGLKFGKGFGGDEEGDFVAFFG